LKTYPYLLSRKGIYYFRKATPRDLLYFIGQREIIKTLGTTDVKVARKAALEMSEQLDELFAKIRNGKKLLSAEEVACVALDFTRVKTEKLLLETLEDFKDRSKEDEEWEAFHAREYRKQTLEDLRQSRLKSAEPDADALLSEHSVSLDKTSALYKQLCRASLRGLADFYVNAEIIVKGDLENPALTLSQLETSTTKPKEINPTPTGIPFAEAVKKYLTDNQSSWGAKQFKSVEAKLNYFLDYASEEDGLNPQQRLLSSITSAQARAYKEHLQRTPTNAKKKYPELSPKETVEAAAKDNAPLLGVTSRNNYLQNLSTLYSFAAKELDYEGDNPFKGRSNSKAAKKNQREQRNPLSKDHLKQLFQSPLFTGCKSLASCYRPGSLVPKESHKYWVPMIGLYTGMRMQEILQLYVADVYQTNDIWVFDLNENHKDQKLKSPQSKRLVPIHHNLLDLGFLEFLGSKRAGRLFEDAPLANDGTYSSTFSKWFSRYLSNIGIKTDRTSFHSLRHNMKDFFREVGESDELAENFMGRSTGTTGEAYGSGFSVKRYSEALHKIRFTEIGVGSDGK
jgi:integrase